MLKWNQLIKKLIEKWFLPWRSHRLLVLGKERRQGAGKKHAQRR
jgi:hypothetical protein